jgi:hypothetical protein
MLAMTPVRPVYSGLLEVREACDPVSLREIAWTIFEQWEAAGSPAGHEWALFAVGHLGDDVAVERLVERLPRWQSIGAAQRNDKAIEAIALVGTPLAFAHLDRIARKSRYPLLRRAASDAVLRVARRLGIHPDELEDRQAPDLDLDAGGGMTFPREGAAPIRATLDEHLAPMILDPSGKRLKSLPKAVGSEGAARFKALVKGARLAAESQIARFERAMTTERTWTPATFLEVVVGHPVLRHLARRVVWSVTRGAGPVFFRVAEDGTLADARDAVFTLDPASDGPVRLAHPAHLGAEVSRTFGQILADYEILQPFLQLARPVFSLRADEIDAGRLLRFEGTVVPWETIAALTRRGFVDSSHGERAFAFHRALPFGVHVGVSVDPGVLRGDPRASGPQRVVQVSAGGRSLGSLSAAAASEVVLAGSALGGEALGKGKPDT